MNKNYFYIILAAVFWGTLGVFATELNNIGLNSFQVSLLRALFSVLFITVVILFRDKKLFRINPRDLWMFFGTGIISYFLVNICNFTAINMIGIAAASILLYTAPIFVTIMSCILFKDKMTKKKALCLVLAVAGCALVSGLASGSSMNISAAGILIGLGSGLTYALYSIFSTYALRKYDSLTVTFYTFLFGTIATFLTGNPIATFSIIASPSGFLLALGLGIIAGAVPYFLYTIGLSKVNPSHAAVIATVEPVIATLIGIFFYEEPGDIFRIIGIALIIAASLLLNSKSKNES